jgi:diguanylate cyclase (GGDEF)-like protein
MRDIFLQIDINILASLLLGFLWLIAIRRQDKNDLLNKIYMYMIALNAAELLLETLTFIVDGMPGNSTKMLAYAANILLFVFGPLIILLWCFFVEYWMFHDTKRLKRKAIFFVTPLVANAILVLSAPLNGLTFSISSDNYYHRGPAFIFTIGLSYLFMLYSVFFIARNKRYVKKDEFLPLLLFTLPCAVAGLLQAFFYGLLLMWSSTAFTLTCMYIYLQQRMNQIDPLTGAWTRGTLDRYLDRRITKSNKTGGFAAIMIDLDNFKQINDTYGHAEGDAALKNVVRILRTALRKEDVVARYGGDEFVIILEMKADKDVENIIKRIRDSFESWNRVSGRKYRLEYSSGYSVYSHESGLKMDEFLFRVDSLMYTSKYQRKMNFSRV